MYRNWRNVQRHINYDMNGLPWTWQQDGAKQLLKLLKHASDIPAFIESIGWLSEFRPSRALLHMEQSFARNSVKMFGKRYWRYEVCSHESLKFNWSSYNSTGIMIVKSLWSMSAHIPDQVDPPVYRFSKQTLPTSSGRPFSKWWTRSLHIHLTAEIWWMILLFLSFKIIALRNCH